jgi:hypothetical protein
MYQNSTKNSMDNIPYVMPTFYNCQEKLPEFNGLNFTVKPIYFVVNNILYRGEYHKNGWFYAYQSCGDIEIMAIGNKQKFVKGISHKKEHEIYAEYWAYSN